MRKWIDLLESGISQWTVDPRLDDNEAEMMSKFHGYDREMRHYSQKEKRIIRQPEYSNTVNAAFSHSPVPFSLYFWQSSNPNYDLTAFQGLVTTEWLHQRLGDETANAILAQTSEDAVTVVFTNNLSDDYKIGLNSPWIVAHRIAHAMVGDSNTAEASRVIQLMKSFLKGVLTVGYGCEWPNDESYYSRLISDDYYEAYGQLMGHTIGTMRSAREGKLVTAYEWFHETVTQFIMTGRVRFKPLPDHFDEGLDLTSHPKRRQAALRAWANMPHRLERVITALLIQGRGKVFVC